MNLELTDDEALVFFEWLSRLDESDAAPCEHDAERHVLWTLHGQLERTLQELNTRVAPSATPRPHEPSRIRRKASGKRVA